MTSTKLEPGAFDGFEKAEPNEPLFTLLARDPLAPALIHEWVDRRRKEIIASDIPAAKRKVELTQAMEAENIALAMIEWRKGYSAIEAPKVDASPVRSYSGNAMDADELAAKARFDTRKVAAQKIRNAIAEIAEAAELVTKYGFEPAINLMALGSGELTRAAEEIEPKRRSYSHRSEEND